MEDEELVLARESSSDIPSLEEHKRPQMRLQVNFQGVFTGVWGGTRTATLTPWTWETSVQDVLKNFTGGEFEAERQTWFEGPGPK